MDPSAAARKKEKRKILRSRREHKRRNEMKVALTEARQKLNAAGVQVASIPAVPGKSKNVMKVIRKRAVIAAAKELSAKELSTSQEVASGVRLETPSTSREVNDLRLETPSSRDVAGGFRLETPSTGRDVASGVRLVEEPETDETLYHLMEEPPYRCGCGSRIKYI